jgi:hypothetical protein
LTSRTGAAVRPFKRPRLIEEKDEESTASKNKKTEKAEEAGKSDDPPPSRRGRERILRKTQVNT